MQPSIRGRGLETQVHGPCQWNRITDRVCHLVQQQQRDILVSVLQASVRCLFGLVQTERRGIGSTHCKLRRGLEPRSICGNEFADREAACLEDLCAVYANLDRRKLHEDYHVYGNGERILTDRQRDLVVVRDRSPFVASGRNLRPRWKVDFQLLRDVWRGLIRHRDRKCDLQRGYQQQRQPWLFWQAQDNLAKQGANNEALD